MSLEPEICFDCKDKENCMARLDNGDAWIFHDQLLFCEEVGTPSYRDDEDWIFDALQEDLD